jgi:hypothetical protein
VAKNLRVIGNDPDEPPRDLGPHGQSLWQKIMAEHNISDTGNLELLFQACSAADRAGRCAEIIQRDGEMIQGSGGGWRDHPLIRQELAARSLVIRTLIRLGVVAVPTRPPGRPGHYPGWNGEA